MPSPQDATTRRDACCAWLTANGINPDHIPADADITISTEPDGTRSIIYEEFHLTPDGKRQIDERLQRAAIRRRSTALIAEPPDWWEPYKKPTRDQLLAGHQRVRALHQRNENTGECEHCSARDYPDYAVPHPCPTVQALDGAGQVTD